MLEGLRADPVDDRKIGFIRALAAVEITAAISSERILELSMVTVPSGEKRNNGSLNEVLTLYFLRPAPAIKSSYLLHK